MPNHLRTYDYAECGISIARNLNASINLKNVAGRTRGRLWMSNRLRFQWKQEVNSKISPLCDVLYQFYEADSQ